MLEELLTDWRFIVALGALLIAVGEARYKISRHEKILDPEKIANFNRHNATLIAEVKALSDDLLEIKSEDIRDIKKDIARFNEKHDEGTARLWTSLENSKERLAKLEGKMNHKT